RHIRKTHLGLVAMVFAFAIPAPLYWTLAFIYAFYLTAPIAGLRFVNDETNLSSASSSRRNPTIFGAKRFQQIWFAVKRFSPIHRPKQNDTNEPRKLSISENEHLVHDSAAGAYKLSWSPFARRRQANKKRYGLYSSHPDICS